MGITHVTANAQADMHDSGDECDVEGILQCSEGDVDLALAKRERDTEFVDDEGMR